MSAIGRFLEDRTPGERLMLKSLAAIALIAVAVAFAWLPIERARARLASQLPALRASIAALERQAGEAKRLRAMPMVQPASDRSLATFAAGGTTIAGAQVSILDAKTVAVNGQDVAFGALLEWLAVAQASQGLRVESARIQALPAPGRVRAEIRLARS